MALSLVWGLAKVRRQKGVALIEMLVASAAGILLISLVGSLYVSVQSHASQRSQLLLLNQALATTARRIQNDMIRAGYDGVKDESLVALGSSRTIFISQSGSVAQYAYRDDRGQAPLENVVWQHDWQRGRLAICREKTGVASGAKATSFSQASGCTSIFEPNLIHVISFSLQSHLVASDNASHQFIEMTIEAQLRQNEDISSTLTRQFLVRNGQ